MAEEIKMVVCKLNLRPRNGTKTKLIVAGTPFEESLIDPESKQMLMEQGNLAYEEAENAPLEEKAPVPDKEPSAKEIRQELVADIQLKFGIKVTSKQFTRKGALQAEYDRLKKEWAPKGVFTKTAEELEDFNLDELDALHAQICSENELGTPDPFESTEQAIAKLTGAED